jgi:2-methylcitrate dehydratase PrpD
MAATNLTSRFAGYFSRLSLNDVPLPVQEVGRWLLLDTIGCIAAGLRTKPARQIESVSTLFAGEVCAAQAGLDDPQGAARAAYANARIANLLDFDETYPVGVHFGIGAVAGAIAGVQTKAKGGNFGDLLTAVVAGYEAGARMASAVGPMTLMSDGEVTGFSDVWGIAAPVVMASCVAYGRARGIDEALMAQAIGIAGSNIPLPIGRKWADAKHLPDVKYCDAGWCAVTGVHGVHSAEAGLSGFHDILEGRSAIPEAYSATMARSDLLHEGLGERWHLLDLTFKPWPCCRFMHAPLTALSTIINREGVKPEEVDEVVIHTGPMAASERFLNPTPLTFASHQFSYAHNCAMLLMGVRPGPDWFDEQLANSPAALALREKVRIERFAGGNDFAKQMIHNQIRVMPGAATIRTSRGEWTLRNDFAQGDPWDSTTKYGAEDVKAKFCVANPGEAAETFTEWLLEANSRASFDAVDVFLRFLPKA